MRGWLQVWSLSPADKNPAMDRMGESMEGTRIPGMASAEEIYELNTLPPEEMDVLFLKLAIVHHEVAMSSAEAFLGETDRPEVEHLSRPLSPRSSLVSGRYKPPGNHGVCIEGPSVPEGPYGDH